MWRTDTGTIHRVNLSISTVHGGACSRQHASHSAEYRLQPSRPICTLTRWLQHGKQLLTSHNKTLSLTIRLLETPQNNNPGDNGDTIPNYRAIKIRKYLSPRRKCYLLTSITWTDGHSCLLDKQFHVLRGSAVFRCWAPRALKT
jgi:hypothetical protein